MDKFTFLNTKFSKEHILNVLSDPKTAEFVYRYLEYTNGRALPSSGVLAGQAVSSAIDYHLGLRDESALVIKDIDHFDHATLDTMQHTRIWQLFLARTMTDDIIDHYLVGYDGNFRWCDQLSTLLQHRHPRGDLQLEATRSFLNVLSLFAGPAWTSLFNAFPKHFGYRRKQLANYLAARVLRAFRSTHPAIQAQLAEYSSIVYKHVHQGAVEQGKTVYAVLINVLKTVPNEFGMPIDASWEVSKESRFYEEITMLRYNDIIHKGILSAEYGVLGVLGNDQAVQSVLTSEVYVYPVIGDRPGCGRIVRKSKVPDIYVDADVDFANSRPYTSNEQGYGWGIVAGFDINNVQVGLDLKSMQLVYTQAYIDFLVSKELLVTNAQTPMLSMIRSIEKSQRLPVFFNKSRILRLGQAVMAKRLFLLDENEESENKVVTRLQATFDEARKTPDIIRSQNNLNFSPAIVGAATAERAASIPEVSQSFSIEPLTKSGYILVPRHAESWQTMLCEVKRSTSADDTESTYRTAIPTTSPLLSALIQQPEMNARWQQRTKRVTQLIAELARSQATHALPRDTMYIALQSMLEGIASRKLTADQVALLDTDELQPVLMTMAQHSEVRLHITFDLASVRWIAQSFKRIQHQFKPVKKWIARIIAEMEAQHVDDFDAEVLQSQVAELKNLSERLSFMVRENLGLPKTDHHLYFDSGLGYLNQTFIDYLNLDTTIIRESSPYILNHSNRSNTLSLFFKQLTPLHAEQSIPPEHLKWYTKISKGEATAIRNKYNLLAGNTPALAEQIFAGDIQCEVYHFTPLQALWQACAASGMTGNRVSTESSFGQIYQRIRGIKEMMQVYLNDPTTPDLVYTDKDGQLRSISVSELVSATIHAQLQRFAENLVNLLNHYDWKLRKLYPRFIECAEVRQYLQASYCFEIPPVPTQPSFAEAQRWLLDAQFAITDKASSLFYVHKLAKGFKDEVAEVPPLCIQDLISKAAVEVVNAHPNTEAPVFAAKELLSQVNLTFEGARMRHCVGGYFTLVKEDRCRILTLHVKVEDKEYRATAEWVRHIELGDVALSATKDPNGQPFAISVNQLRGPSNGEPHPLIEAFHRKLLALVNQNPLDVWQTPYRIN